MYQLEINEHTPLHIQTRVRALWFRTLEYMVHDLKHRPEFTDGQLVAWIPAGRTMRQTLSGDLNKAYANFQCRTGEELSFDTLGRP